IYFRRNEDSLCSCCWSSVLTTMLAAGLLAVLSLLHIALSSLGRDPCQSNTGTDSVGESLLNSRQENYDRFEEVLDENAVAGTATMRYDSNDGPPGLVNAMRIASLNRGRVKSPHYFSP
ncbi:hypothetical protein ALC60_05461, partial [Trachymyrmex zeteki]